eukprot:12287-Heterococcus_DN1.PRE.3
MMHSCKLCECVQEFIRRFSAYSTHYPYLALTNMSLRLLNIDCIIKKHAPLNTTAAAVASALVLIDRICPLCSEGYS